MQASIEQLMQMLGELYAQFWIVSQQAAELQRQLQEARQEIEALTARLPQDEEMDNGQP